MKEIRKEEAAVEESQYSNIFQKAGGRCLIAQGGDMRLV